MGAAGLAAAAILAGSAGGGTTARISLADCTISERAARCGVLTVPEDAQDPGGRRLALDVVVLPHTGGKGSSEALFVLSGGPGQAATAQAGPLAESLEAARRRHDVVLIDQRGTAGAHQLACAVAPRTFVVPLDARRCLQRLSGKARLGAYGTSNFVDDLEAARDALGYASVSLYGASYGTRVAFAYARRYPARVRSAVLLAPAPIATSVIDGFDTDSDGALAVLVDDCLSDPRCAGAFPKLRTDLRIVQRELADPFHVLGLRFLQYSSTTARSIPYLVTEAAAGRQDPLDEAIGAFREQLVEQLSLGLHLTIMCSEEPGLGPTDTATPSSARREYARACAGWPRTPVPAGFLTPSRVDVPALLIVGERDPVTPPRVARLAARQFSTNQVVVVPRAGHLFAGPPGCLGAMIAGFLDGGTADASCLSALEPPPFRLSR